MKKVLIFLILLFPIKVYSLSASSYVVMDFDSGRVLDGKNINDKKLIASTTKIMTAIIAIENADINKTVEISKEVLKSYGSGIYVEVGERITLRELLYGLMLRSGNDAALEIANYVSGSMDNFVKLMNEKVKELNMNNTLFINSSGLEDQKGNGNMSSAYDMAKLMRYALNNDTFREIDSTKKIIVKTNYKTYEWHNKNKLLTQYKYTIGGKTGYTKKAKRTLVSAAKKDDKTLIIVTLNDPNDFNDHMSLYESIFPKYNLVKILDKDNFKINGYDNTVYIKNDYNILLTDKEEERIKTEYQINDNGSNIFGNVNILLNNKIIDSIPIYKKEIIIEEKKNNWFKKLIDLLVFWD